MNAKTLLRFVFLLLLTTGSFYFLEAAAEASATRIQLEEEKGNSRLVGASSNTEYIFFESITKFVASNVVK